MKLNKIKRFILGAFVITMIPTITFGYQATFQPRVTLATEHTDNLERTNEDEEDDIITTLSPGFSLDRKSVV